MTLFRRYSTKAALISAALSERLAALPFAHVHASDDARADLLAIATAYETTNRAYGAAVAVLITEIPRHPEIRAVMSTLQPNLINAASVIAAHQARGTLAPANPLVLLTHLRAPLVTAGI
ncbi:hypothetical protein FHX48_000746 [Microbacterium halimionae]|uniref:Uncharacterized protein n=1 Tax=Microbacterium halimionae TaxID=1526413 RepID=A0A7W3JMP2_9MICO|nr:TetR/AcrR family transcriptional regulator C-terminal ligand-binding domain-containing protein [Microbacterium halimionae]MBA8815694.1 hypothetical protein [Microbacterium halimionae]NII95740.1 hypothetical protein [Microbacterium halimionae]